MYAVIQLHYLFSEEMINKLFYSILFYFLENLGLFWFVSVCYETVLFVSVVSI
jgi:hypothetical protein